MDEVYRGYRIAVKEDAGWTARVTHVRGPLIPLAASATTVEGAEVCLARARTLVDRYISFLSANGLGGDPH